MNSLERFGYLLHSVPDQSHIQSSGRKYRGSCINSRWAHYCNKCPTASVTMTTSQQHINTTTRWNRCKHEGDCWHMKRTHNKMPTHERWEILRNLRHQFQVDGRISRRIWISTYAADRFQAPQHTMLSLNCSDIAAKSRTQRSSTYCPWWLYSTVRFLSPSTMRSDESKTMRRRYFRTVQTIHRSTNEIYTMIHIIRINNPSVFVEYSTPSQPSSPTLIINWQTKLCS